MFANRLAIETLVSSDTKATQAEKELVLSSLRCGAHKADADGGGALVYSIADAAKFLGKPRKAIYNLLRTGTLRGFYSGKTHARATGVIKASLDEALTRSKFG